MATQRKSSSSRLILAIVLIAASLISAFIFSSLANQKTTMIVSTTFLLPGHQITENDLIFNPLYTENSIIDWWKPKAIARYKTLKAENRLKPDVLYYDKMIGMDYQTAKNTYFSEVGR